MAAAMAASQRLGTRIWSSESTSLGRSPSKGAVVAGTSLRWRQACRKSGPLSISLARRSAAHPVHQRLDLRCSGLSSITGSQAFSCAELVLRYLAPRPPVGEETSARALVIRAGILDILKGFLSAFWNTVIKGPVATFAKFFQREVDDATDIVKGGAQVVLNIAHTVDNLADAVEAYAENVATFAEKVIETTDKVDEKLLDVVQAIENADDVDELAASIAEETGISLDTLKELKEKTKEVKEKTTELKAASSELKDVSKVALQENKAEENKDKKD